MKRVLIFVYGVVSYFIFFATILYAIGFVGNFLVPVSIDSAPVGDLTTAIMIDVGLLGIFAVQHSVMARPAFKRVWTRIIPEAAERSTYVLLTCAALILLFVYWKPLGGQVWTVTNPLAANILYGIFGLGWAIVFLSSFLINHFDLFGLRQVWLNLMDHPYSKLSFKTPFLYKYVRHPLYVGLILGFWATPDMTVTHLFFAIATTAYIFIGIQFEEHDLKNALPEYAAYREHVPMIVPRFSGK
jgi:protein-S-isoprenylcysteine O-methyltransferase Ste14